MACNFRVSTQKNSENVHLQLIGDFDGISAHQLLDVLEKNCKNADKIFIHTNSLRRIHPFGCSIFHHHLSTLKRPSIDILFTGENANKFIP